MIKKIKENKTLNILYKIIKALIALAIILIVFIIVVQRIFNNNISIGGYRIFTIVTESMVPEYNVYDIIISKEIDANKIKVGDDVVYLGKVDTFSGKIITHRVIDIDNSSSPIKYTTQGIANSIADPEIDETQIYGIVLGKSKVLSLISKAVNNPIGFYLLILIPTALLIFSEIIGFINDKKEKNNCEHAKKEEENES